MKNTKINGRWELILPDHRADRAEWQTGWEVERLDSMFKNIKPGDTVVDVGAEEGDMTALLSVWSGKPVILSEPNPKVWPNIKAIFEANNIPLPLYYVGFFGANTDEGSKLKEESVDQNGWPTCAYGELIGDHGFRHLAEETDTTPTVTLDDFKARNNVSKIDVITMDVEGSEWEVLKGCEKLIASDKPMIFVSIHCAFMYHHFKQDPTDFIHWMQDRGYKYHFLAWDHEIHMLFYHVDGRQPVL